MEELLITSDEKMKNPNWSYLYTYNLRTLRDIFIYCSVKGKIKEEQLYRDMAGFKIPPPKERWVSKDIKRGKRLRLEYIHASEYLGFICKEDGIIKPNLSNFRNEKKEIIRENKHRVFKACQESPPFTQKEKESLIKIVLNYERAKDFLNWFLDFLRFPNINSFGLDDFIKEAKPIFVLGKVIPSKKGSDTIKREIDNKLWRIPDSYIRLVSIFKNWFSELGVMDSVAVFQDFSEDSRLWHMFYPIKMTIKDFLARDISAILKDLFLKNKSKESIWIPHLLYIISREFNCPIEAIKKAIEKIYKEDPIHFYLERTSLQVMKRRTQYENSYIKVDGFYRSTLKLTREGDKNYG